ncbi:MAG: hypothetical protein ABR921_00465 [Candidatus Sulfotelmatobacter sp.]|jgi:hypothetical protein
MPIVIQPYRAEHEAAVKEFNLRLKAGGADPDLVFFRSAQPRWLPPMEGSDLYQEFFVALDDGVVRGGYALKQQNFSFADGSMRRVAYYHHPLSEGIVNKAYAVVGSLLLKHAMNRSPLLYCLGMNGYDRPLPKMLVRLGWAHCLVPFYFSIVQPYRFLREMQALRGSSGRRLLMDFAALSGTGWAATRTLRAWRRFRAPGIKPFTVEKVDEFSAWVDPLWQETRSAFAMTAVRDSATLRTLYAASDQHFTRLRIRRNGSDIGWAVVGERRKDEKYGAMRVGSIVDCWASPEDALPVLRAAADALEQSGYDLIVSNQSHHQWGRALEQCGFLQADSNFIFAASKGLAALLQPFDKNQSLLHFTRADGDGLPRNF